jgi:hypothetical protein
MEYKYIAAILAFAFLVSAVTLTIVFRNGWYMCWSIMTVILFYDKVD